MSKIVKDRNAMAARVTANHITRIRDLETENDELRAALAASGVDVAGIPRAASAEPETAPAENLPAGVSRVSR